MLSASGESFIICGMAEAIQIVREEQTRPTVLMRPKVFQDGNRWCALYGDSLMEGVCAFGETPDEATRAFDRVWLIG